MAHLLRRARGRAAARPFSLRSSVPATALLSMTALAACSGAPGSVDPGEDGALGASASPITGDYARIDDDTPWANVTVALANGCSGTLISPTAVLTAWHCINGDDGVDPKPDVGVGQDRARGLAGYHSVGSITMGSGRYDKSQFGRDLALVFLDRPVLDRAAIARPSLTPPAGDGDTYRGTYGMAGWSPFTSDDANASTDPGHLEYRYAAFFSSLTLKHYTDHGGEYWVYARGHEQIHHGDSGGTLFSIYPYTVIRNPIGVISSLTTASPQDILDCGTSLCEKYVDITRGAPARFIRDMMTDHAHDNQPNWRTMHPSPSGDGVYWKGEVDYTGVSCARDRDGDCDHWYDAHDNCPLTPNTDQADADDDDVGDACPVLSLGSGSGTCASPQPSLETSVPFLIWEGEWRPADRSESIVAQIWPTAADGARFKVTTTEQGICVGTTPPAESIVPAFGQVAVAHDKDVYGGSSCILPLPPPHWFPLSASVSPAGLGFPFPLPPLLPIPATVGPSLSLAVSPTVQLTAYRDLCADGGRGKYHLRYVRTDASGGIKTDVMLTYYNPPPR